MPRESPFRIELSEEERQELESRVRKYTSPYRDVIRAKIVLLSAASLAHDDIAARLDTPRQIVRKGRRRFYWARLPGWEDPPRGGRLVRFPPRVVVQVKALACELPYRLGLPLSRLSLSEIPREVLQQGIVAEIRGTTLWRWLRADALCPWRPRRWIFPRDPDLAEKAGRILDLYERRWNRRPLQATEFVISADEKTSLPARRRQHPSWPPSPGCPRRVEQEYHRAGAWSSRAAGDVHRAKLLARCEAKNGIGPVNRWGAQVRSPEPYRSARRVFSGSWTTARLPAAPKPPLDCAPTARGASGKGYQSKPSPGSSC